MVCAIQPPAGGNQHERGAPAR